MKMKDGCEKKHEIQMIERKYLIMKSEEMDGDKREKCHVMRRKRRKIKRMKKIMMKTMMMKE